MVIFPNDIYSILLLAILLLLYFNGWVVSYLLDTVIHSLQKLGSEEEPCLLTASLNNHLVITTTIYLCPERIETLVISLV